jgi:lipopolysaccharide/colanic/teichoic acid biosynthesis glycosyltransferase
MKLYSDTKDMYTEVFEKQLVAPVQQQFSAKSYISYLWYMMGLPVILLIPAWLTWNSLVFSPAASVMISLTTLVYLMVLVARYKTSTFQSYRAIGLSAFYITVGFILIIVILAGFRLYYSRIFLLSSYFLCIGWFGAGMVIFEKVSMNLLVIKGGFADLLMPFASNGWKFINMTMDEVEWWRYDGIAVDLHAHDNRSFISKLADLSLHNIPLRHAVSVYEHLSGRIPLSYSSGERFRGRTPGLFYYYIKRGMEFALSCLIGTVMLPVMLLTVLIIKLESNGPVFFTQQRIGKNGKIFTLYKFRSMVADSERNGSQFAQKEDKRITVFGKFIRKFRIDELPQLWNVIRGDMNLIGPRPEQPDFVDFFKEEIPFYAYRHRVRPGITGWAQIKDGYAADTDATKRKLEYDLYYIKYLSLSLDLLIVYATIKTVLTGFGSR